MPSALAGWPCLVQKGRRHDADCRGRRHDHVNPPVIDRADGCGWEASAANVGPGPPVRMRQERRTSGRMLMWDFVGFGLLVCWVRAAQGANR